MQNAYYREFYEKALIQAGNSDKKTFLDIQPDLVHTHLLIGLQGHPVDDKEYYHWNVTIYKSDSGRFYDACTPIFSSAPFDRFDDAVEAARNIEKEVRNDQLHNVMLQEKIS
ncbi:hypothetical protein V7654_19535 [Bacillus sp. JJ1609]|uniref:hypothetical protein n=1 Tax=Bacillus sp. JJ1609 TaxID=3122977 RepID=UPI002FFDCFC9